MYRQVIAGAAEAIFADKGFADAKRSHVAERAGISLKTLYATFVGKQELFEALRNLRVREVLERTTAIPDRGPALELLMTRLEVSAR
jgi:AcrR family transcriptional regulator